jgi:hypothetical protein
VFLEITDDNSRLPVEEFSSALAARAPDLFAGGAAQPSFVWHSIVGVAERPVVTDPYAPSDPIEQRECAGDVANAGTEYQELSQQTGGLRFPICAFNGYDVVFRRIASDVVQTSRNACDFAIPAPPAGRSLDLDKVTVSYQPGSGGAAQRLGRVSASGVCGAGADTFWLDAAGVHLCDAACAAVSADASASVSVLFTCENTLIR